MVVNNYRVHGIHCVLIVAFRCQRATLYSHMKPTFILQRLGPCICLQYNYFCLLKNAQEELLFFSTFARLLSAVKALELVNNTHILNE